MKAIIKIITLLLLTTICQFAFADAMFTPVQTDKMMFTLNSLFGTLGAFGASSNDPMIAFVRVINTVAMVTSGLLLAYTLLAGTLGTAHDGEVLGKKYSAMTLPIKVVLACALIYPLPSGYNSMQLLVGKVITMGIGMADYTASSLMSDSSLNSIASTSLIQPEPKNLAYNLFASYACLNAVKEFTKDNDILYKGLDLGLSKEEGIKNTVYYFGNKKGTAGITKDACGKMEISKWQVPASETSNAASSVLLASEAITRMKVVVAENEKQTSLLMTKMDNLAKKLIVNSAPINPAEIETAIGVYTKAVDKVAAAQITSLDQFSNLKKSIDKDGFIFVGAYYSKISKMIDLTNSSVANVPVASGVTVFPVASLADRWSPVFKDISKTLDLSSGGIVSYGIANEQGGGNKSWLDTVKDTVMNGFDATILLKKIFTSSTKTLFSPGGNLMLKVQTIGGWALALASASFVGLAAAAATIGVHPGIGSLMCAMILAIVGPLWIFGFTCLYLIPMLPYLMWIGAILAYLIVCIEAIVGCSLWLISMLAEGHEIMGGAQKGFQTLITLLFKPVLMVAGFAASVIVLQVFGTLVNDTFAEVWNLAQADSGFLTYLAGMFAAPFVYVALAVIVIKSCFNIMHTLPDAIMDLMNAGTSKLGGHAGEIAGAVTAGAAVTAAGMTANGATNAMQNKINNNQLASNFASKNGPNPGGSSPSSPSISEGNASSGGQNQVDNNNTNEGEKMGTDYLESEVLKDSGSGIGLAKDKAHLSKAVENIGGKDSDEARDLLERVNDLRIEKPEQILHKSINSAMNSQLNSELGNGVGKWIAKKSGGYTTPEAKKSIEMFRDTAQKMSDSGLSAKEVKANITNAVSQTFSLSDRDMSQAIEKVFDKQMGIEEEKEIAIEETKEEVKEEVKEEKKEGNDFN